MSKSIKTRARTCDVAYGFRMNTGFAGDVNRTQPASIEPNMNDATNPVNLFGNAVLVNGSANTVRKVLATDTGVTAIYGIAVRPYPTQQTSGGSSAAFGVGGPAANQPVDVLRQGYFMTKVVGSPVKDGTVYLWVAADSGAHVQGGFEASSSASTVTLTNVFFNGPAGADGVAELYIRTR